MPRRTSKRPAETTPEMSIDMLTRMNDSASADADANDRTSASTSGSTEAPVLLTTPMTVVYRRIEDIASGMARMRCDVDSLLLAIKNSSKQADELQHRIDDALNQYKIHVESSLAFNRATADAQMDNIMSMIKSMEHRTELQIAANKHLARIIERESVMDKMLSQLNEQFALHVDRLTSKRSSNQEVGMISEVRNEDGCRTQQTSSGHEKNRLEGVPDDSDEDLNNHDPPAPQAPSTKDAADVTMKVSRLFIALPSSGESAAEVQPNRLCEEGRDGQDSTVNKQCGNSFNGTGNSAKKRKTRILLSPEEMRIDSN